MVKVTSLLIKAGSALRLEVHLGSVLESELRQMWHIKGMYKLKVVSSKKMQA